jgi:2,4-dienoyl-CoA reductase-like NADH-dependent reductase (Old Yellow Enzyme family)
MTTSTTSLFSPIAFNRLLCKNRLAVAPMTRVTATEAGQATEMMARYYERFARGGFGLVISEGTYPDQAFAQAYHNQPGISDEAQANAWKPVVKAIKAHGALVIAQLMHAGAISQGNRFMSRTAGPSAIQPKGKQLAFYYGKDAFTVPLEMTEKQIADAITGFGDSAARAVGVAGFDGIEIHGANGYLLDQFLTDYTNQRSDHWGGNIERRIRLMLAVFRAVREKVGAAVPVGIRISQGKVNDSRHRWQGRERDAEVIFGNLADAGVDYIHVTDSEAWKPAFSNSNHSLVYFARKYAAKVVLIANGNLHVAERALAALDDGADIISVGRAALANPDLPLSLATNAPLKVFDPAILGPIANIKDSELAI